MYVYVYNYCTHMYVYTHGCFYKLGSFLWAFELYIRDPCFLDTSKNIYREVLEPKPSTVVRIYEDGALRTPDLLRGTLTYFRTVSSTQHSRQLKPKSLRGSCKVTPCHTPYTPNGAQKGRVSPIRVYVGLMGSLRPLSLGPSGVLE